MTDFDRFAHPWVLWLIAAVPVVMLLARIRRRPGAVLFPGVGAVRVAGASLRTRLLWLPGLLRGGALALMLVALARPQDVEGLVRTRTEGIAMQLVIDRSSSMSEQIAIDGRATSRLDAVKKVATEFIAGNGDDLQGREGDMIGVIVFGSFADTVCPLVREHEALVELVDGIDIAASREEGGTAIGDAVALAAARLREAEKEVARGLDDADDDPDFTIKSKALILLTDGRNNRGDIAPLDAANLCKEWGITLYTIGIGGGSVVEIAGMRVPRGPNIDSATMQRMARMTGGDFFLADSAEALRSVYATIDELEKTEIETSESVDYEERFTPFAAAGLALLGLERLLAGLWLRRVP